MDETLTIIILVGMQNAKDRLLQINEYYFDRCNVFYEFQPAVSTLMNQNYQQIQTKDLDLNLNLGY